LTDNEEEDLDFVDHIPDEQHENADPANCSPIESNHHGHDQTESEYDVILVKPLEQSQVKKLTHIIDPSDKEAVQIDISDPMEEQQPADEETTIEEEPTNEAKTASEGGPVKLLYLL
jgi:hypothetical protein